MQGIKNRRVKQDLGRWLLCELRGIGVDFADREESIFLLEPFTRTPRLQNWKNWRPRGTVRGLLSRMSALEEMRLIQCPLWMAPHLQRPSLR